MSATEELRALLDERGVKWYGTINHVNCVFTWWNSPTFGEVHAMDNEDGKTLFMACLNNCDFTPEQAIAATLGGEECVMNRVKMFPEHKDCIFECWECSACKGTNEEQRPRFCPNCGRKVKR